MNRRFLVGGVVAALVGVLLLILPLEAGTSGSASLSTDQSISVPVPLESSVTTTSVYLHVEWGGPCIGTSCTSYVSPPYLSVYDCGTGPCATGNSYPLVGSTAATDSGSSDIVVIPGHHYLLQVQPSSSRSVGDVMMIRYTLVTPALGGWLGALALACGALAIVLAVAPRSGRLPKESNHPSGG